MKISEVMKETGLTKKAIYFYEEAELINPQRGEGSYRIYSPQDIENLIMIQALRKLDFSIKDIQSALAAREDFAEVIKDKLKSLNNEIDRLTRNKAVLEDFLEDDKRLNTEDLRRLIGRLDDQAKGTAGYMQKELDRILPGNLGKMLAVYYGQFLDEPLDTAAKEQAWHDLVCYLDAQDEFQYPENIRMLIDEFYGKHSDRYFVELDKKARDVTAQILAGTSETSEAQRNQIKARITEYMNTPQYQKFLEFQRFTADNLAPIFKDVDKYVCVLSSRFAKYNKILSDAAPLLTATEE